MDDETVDAQAPVEEQQLEEAAPPEAQPEAQPEDAPASAQPTPLDQLIERINARFTALEAIAHSGHNLDDSAIDQIAALVWERFNARIQQHLG